MTHASAPLVIKAFGEGVRHLLSPQLYVEKDEWSNPPEWVEPTVYFAPTEEASRHLLVLGVAVKIVAPVSLRAQVYYRLP